jgi:large subunit ribosomal protein L10
VTNLRSLAGNAASIQNLQKHVHDFAAKEAGYDDLIRASKADGRRILRHGRRGAGEAHFEFVKDNKLQTLAFKGGVIDRVIVDVETIAKIAQLPSKDTLLSKMLGSLNAPIANFARVLGAIKDQKESSA